YTKTLSMPCNNARRSQNVCESGSEDSKTTGGLCFISGCDKRPGIHREGPGDRTDGGFDSVNIDWSAF
ncbi:hypothetical protein K505DRAFT_261337, partial [Melanomma pulvis-pyrius CBS 109.77]